MSKVVCPYCFERFDRSDVEFRCGNAGQCRIEDDPVLHAFWNENKATGLPIPRKRSFLSFGAPDSATCPECGKKSYLMICPKCHNRVPSEMVRKKGMIISIVGARSSGKTVYITTLINELRRKCNYLGDIGITACNVADDPRFTTQARYDRDFFSVLYDRGTCPPQTQVGDKSSRIPLIYEICKKGHDPIHLVFYDTAGENFYDLRNIHSNVKFLLESDAIIFLLDTVNVPKIHSALGVKAPLDMQKNPPFDRILDNLITYFSDHPDVAKSLLKKPTAMVLTKIDVLLNNFDKFEEQAPPGLTMANNSPYLMGDPISLSDIDSIHWGLQSLLTAWDESNFLNIVKNKFDNAKLFGISALGKAPDSANNVKGINPYRVLDPLVWILHEFKYPLPVIK